MFQSHKHTVLSAIMAVFLTGTLVITATVISNPNISFDIRKFAAQKDDIAFPTQTKTVPSKVAQNLKQKDDVYTPPATIKNPVQKDDNANTHTTTTTHTERDDIVAGPNAGSGNNTHTTFTTTTTTDPTTGKVTNVNTQINDTTVDSAGKATSTSNVNLDTKITSTLEKTDNGFVTDTTRITTDANNNNAIVSANSNQTIGHTTTTKEKTDTGFVTNTTTITQDANTGKIVDANTTTSVPTPTAIPSLPNSLNPNVTYTPTCSPGYTYNKATLHCELPSSSPATNAPGCTLKCATGQYCKATGAGRAGTIYQCVATPSPIVTGTLPTGTDCTSGSQCSSGRCGRAPHVSGAEAANTGHSGNFCQPSDAEINHTVTVELAAVGGALATAVGATELAGAAGTIWTLAGGSVAALPTAAAAYGSAAITSTLAGLSPLAQIGVGAGITTLTLGGTYNMANQCAQTWGIDPNCAFLAAPIFNDLQGTLESFTMGPQMINQGVNRMLSSPTTVPGFTLLGDIHSDPAAAKAYLLQQGAIDQYGNKMPGQKIIFAGDAFGKNTSALSPTGGNEALDFAIKYADIKVAGNWEPKCVAGVCALLNGDSATLAKLTSKTLSLADVQLAAENPAAFAAKINQLDYVHVLPGQSANTLVQHVDTGELARFALSPTDLLKLQKSDPELAIQVAKITNLSQTYTPLSPSDLEAVNKAVKTIGLSPTEIAGNINNSAHDIVTYALNNPNNSTAMNNLNVLQSTMNQDLTFYGPESSQMINPYADMFNADTILHGHSPVVRMQNAIQGVTTATQALVGGSSYNGIYTDPTTGINLVNIDANLSSGMRTPVWIQDVQNGVSQIPQGMAPYLPQTQVPTFLQIGPNAPTTPLFGTP